MASLPNFSQSVPPPPPYDPSEDTRTELAYELYANLTFTTRSKLPTEDEVLAHLRLLHAFSSLKDSIWHKDGLFNLYDEDVKAAVYETPNITGSVRSELETSLLDTLRQQRWKVYVTRAVDRFTIWWEKLKSQFHSHTLTFGRMVKIDRAFTEKWFEDREGAAAFRTLDLPPLDVLMVWHSYMLHPRCFLEDCVMRDTHELWRVGMPWALINAYLDQRAEVYNPDPEVKMNFEKSTGLKWANTSGPEKTTRKCPNFNCRKPIVIPYAGSDRAETLKWAQTCFGGGSWSKLLHTNGYADANFHVSCPTCRVSVDHNYLQAAIFIDDFTSRVAAADGVALREQPMRGTVLDADGRLRALDKIQKDARGFPNALLRSMTDQCKITSSKNFESIKEIVEGKMSGSSTKARIHGLLSGYSGQIIPYTKLYVERMISRYEDGTSQFGLDLVSAVMRQGSFMDRIERLHWLHSPVAPQMISRFIKKYQRFFELITTSTDTVAIPTFEVDLCWHTHQLSPRKYYAFSTSKTRKLIDHDERSAQNSLRAAFTETSKTYFKMYNEPFSQCICSYCEDMRVNEDSGINKPSYHLSDPITLDNPTTSQASIHSCT